MNPAKSLSRPDISSISFGILALILVTFATSAGEPAEPSLNTGDRVQIRVFGEEDLTVNELIDDHGRISFPLLGELEVAGLSPAGLAALIDGKLRGPYLVDPKVSVSVDAYRDFYVVGQVNRPGGYPYTPGLTARKAVSAAGGYTERASRSKLFLAPEGAQGQEHRIEPDEAVAPGDTLIVKESFF